MVNCRRRGSRRRGLVLAFAVPITRATGVAATTAGLVLVIQFVAFMLAPLRRCRASWLRIDARDVSQRFAMMAVILVCDGCAGHGPVSRARVVWRVHRGCREPESKR